MLRSDDTIQRLKATHEDQAKSLKLYMDDVGGITNGGGKGGGAGGSGAIRNRSQPGVSGKEEQKDPKKRGRGVAVEVQKLGLKTRLASGLEAALGQVSTCLIEIPAEIKSMLETLKREAQKDENADPMKVDFAEALSNKRYGETEDVLCLVFGVVECHVMQVLKSKDLYSRAVQAHQPADARELEVSPYLETWFFLI